MPSTFTIQSVINLASAHIELLPIVGVGGFTNEPALSIATDVLQTVLSSTYELPDHEVLSLDWKWNRAEMNIFVTAPYRQDYLFAGATFFSIAGNACGAGIDLAANNALTISGATVTVRLLETYLGAVGDTCYILGTGSTYDSILTRNGGVTGLSGNTYTVTNISGLVVTATLTGSASGTSGSAGINDFGWLSGITMLGLQTGGAMLAVRHPEAVRDIQRFSFAGIPTEWAMIQDLGTGVLKFRCRPVAGTAVWGVEPVYQKKAPLITSLSNTWAPIPDEVSYLYRQGFLAQAFRYASTTNAAAAAKAEVEEQKFIAALRRALGADSREMPDISLQPAEGLRTSDWDVQFLL